MKKVKRVSLITGLVFVTFAAVPVVCKMLQIFYAFKTSDFNDNLELRLKKKKKESRNVSKMSFNCRNC